jgi:hypothetical protein
LARLTKPRLYPLKSPITTTPYELWFKKQPDLNHIRILGMHKHIVHIPKEKHVKLDSNTKKCQLVGYADTNQYRVWDPEREDVIIARDVIFNEDDEAQKPHLSDAIISEYTSSNQPEQPNQPQIIHDTIEVLRRPLEPLRQVTPTHQEQCTCNQHLKNQKAMKKLKEH